MVGRGGWRRGPTAREREMRSVLRELERSGLGVTEFARQRGISPGTLGWWRHVLRQRGRGEAREAPDERGFVEVVVDGGAAATSTFEVVLRSGSTVRVPSDFDAAALRRLIATLEAAC